MQQQQQQQQQQEPPKLQKTIQANQPKQDETPKKRNQREASKIVETYLQTVKHIQERWKEIQQQQHQQQQQQQQQQHTIGIDHQDRNEEEGTMKSSSTRKRHQLVKTIANGIGNHWKNQWKKVKVWTETQRERQKHKRKNQPK